MTNFDKFWVFLSVGSLIVNVIRTTLSIAQGNTFIVPLIGGILNVIAIILFVATAKNPRKEISETNTQ